MKENKSNVRDIILNIFFIRHTNDDDDDDDDCDVQNDV